MGSLHGYRVWTNGKIIDADDYFAIDRGFASKSIPNTPYTGYQNGDFNLDGVIDADDYFLIDDSFAQQGVGVALVSAKAISAAQPRKRRGRHHRAHHN